LGDFHFLDHTVIIVASHAGLATRIGMMHVKGAGLSEDERFGEDDLSPADVYLR